jgi:two-component system, NarL family, sensor histidine kinase DevS
LLAFVHKEMRVLLPRFAPTLALSVCFAVSLILAAIMVGIAMDQRWLGLKLAGQPDLVTGPVEFDGVWIEAVDLQGPAAAIRSFVALVSITGLDGTTIRLEPTDLTEEPDSFATYEEMRAFFDRQSRIARFLGSSAVDIETQAVYGPAATDRISPLRQRPVTSLPFAFWMQLGVGFVSLMIGAWVWSLRPREAATRLFALVGLSILGFSFPAAVYTTRELALNGELFSILSAVNHFFALAFGVAMIALLLTYPRPIVSLRWLIPMPLVFGAWWLGDVLMLVPGPPLGHHLPTVIEMAGILVAAGLQFWKTKGDPLARAALTWFGLSVAVGAGAFVATIIVPNLLGLTPVFAQGEAFLFFLLIHAGVALGVARYRLFQLDEWAFRILFYVVAVLLLVALDALLVFTIVDARAPAFALSLLAVAFVYLPLRDTLARLVLRRREPNRESLFRRVMDVALTPPGEDQRARWKALLETSFSPLRIEPLDGATEPALADEGLALAVPGPRDLPGFRLEYAGGGRKLFSRRDVELAGELAAMLTNALESREAYEKGVAEERQRIARDIHDNIGVQLMGALHSREHARKDLMIRETPRGGLTELS